MKIDSVQQSGRVEGYKKVPSRQTVESGVSEVSDRVEFSFDATSFSSVFNAVKDDMDSRSQAEKDHIAQIASQVEAGTYKVSGKDVADKILGGNVDIEI